MNLLSSTALGTSVNINGLPWAVITEITSFEANKTYLVDGKYYQEQSDKYGNFITIDGNRWKIGDA